MIIGWLARLVGPQAARPVLWGLVILGAFLALWAIYGAGKRAGETATEAKVTEAAQKVERAAHKAEQAAVLADMARSVDTAREADEIREIIDDIKSETGVGPATAGVLARLREKRSSAAHSGS